jgi:hypothetical protein
MSQLFRPRNCFKSAAAKISLQRWKQITYAAKNSPPPAFRIRAGFFSYGVAYMTTYLLSNCFKNFTFMPSFLSLSLYLSISISIYSYIDLCESVEPLYQFVFVSVRRKNKLSTCFSFCKAVKTPYKPVSLSARR